MSFQNNDRIDVQTIGSIPITLEIKEKSGTCFFCYGWCTTKCTVMGELVCYDCKDKILERIRTIIKFQ